MRELFPATVAGVAIPNPLHSLEELEVARCTDLATRADADLMGEEQEMRRLHAVTRHQRCRVVFPDAGVTGSILVCEWALWRLKMVRAEIDSRRARRSA
jgi:hypothetical protein